MHRSLLAILTMHALAACGSSQPTTTTTTQETTVTETRRTEVRPPEPEPTPPEPAAPTPSVIESLLAAEPEGTALFVVVAGGRRFAVVRPSEVNPTNEGPTVQSAQHIIRLEEGAPIVAPRTLQLVSGHSVCPFSITQTFHAEVSAQEGDANAPAGRALSVAEGTIPSGCRANNEFGGIAIVSATAPEITDLPFQPARGAAVRANLNLIPRSTQPRPPDRVALSFATVGANTILAVSTPPDADGCATGEITYVLGPRHTGAAYPGVPEPQVIRIGEQSYVIVVENTTDPGRPASHVRVVPLATDQQPLLDVDVPVPWMTGPNC